MARGVRPWSIALAASLLLHGVLLGNLERVLPRWEHVLEAPPIEVRLAALPKPAVTAAALIPQPALSTPRARKHPLRPAPRQPAAAIETDPPAEPAAAAAAPVSATPEAVDAAEAIAISESPAEDAFPTEPTAVATEPAAEDIAP